jgi:hypothetical protein
LIDGFESNGGFNRCWLHGEKGSTGAGFRRGRTPYRNGALFDYLTVGVSRV